MTKVENPQGLQENRKVARSGGSVAGNARREIEARTGKKIVTADNAKQLGLLMPGLIESVAAGDSEDEEQ